MRGGVVRGSTAAARTLSMRSRTVENEPGREASLAAVVERCRADPAAMAELLTIYGDVDRETAEAGLGCLSGGACCRFDLAEHRLYLSVLELALLTAQPPPDLARAGRMRCPYQIGPACTAHSRRPLGCRTFFCGHANRPFLRQLHERSHRRIRQAHRRHCVPYAYGEACATLRRLYHSE